MMKATLVVNIDGWFVKSCLSRIVFTNRRYKAKLFNKSEATEIQKRVKSACEPLLSLANVDVLILGKNERRKRKRNNF